MIERKRLKPGPKPRAGVRGEMLRWRVDPALIELLSQELDPRGTLETAIRQVMVHRAHKPEPAAPQIPDRLRQALERAATQHGLTLDLVIDRLLAACDRSTD